MLASYGERPSQKHLEAAKRELRHLDLDYKSEEEEQPVLETCIWFTISLEYK